jgi:hypothetical protein
MYDDGGITMELPTRNSFLAHNYKSYKKRNTWLWAPCLAMHNPPYIPPLATFWLHTWYFTQNPPPPPLKSKGVRTGEREGHANGPPLPLNDVANSGSTSQEQCEKMNVCPIQLNYKISVSAERNTILQHVWEWKFVNYVTKEVWADDFHVWSLHYSFTLRLSCTCSKCTLGGSLSHMTHLRRLTRPETWNMPHMWSHCDSVTFMSQNVCAHVCRKLRPKLFIVCCKFLGYL